MKNVSLENSRGYMNTTLKNGECPVKKNAGLFFGNH